MENLGIAIIAMAIIYLIIRGLSEGDKMKYSENITEQVFSGIVSSALFSCVGMEQAAGVE